MNPSLAAALVPTLPLQIAERIGAWSTATTVEWTWDAGTRAIAERLAAQPRPDGRTIRVAASGAIPHTLNYYRITRRWKWLEDVKPGADVRNGQFDYYVLLGEDREWAESRHMTILYEHPIATSVLVKGQ